MENKDLYTPEEVARMCLSYRSVKGGFNGPVHNEIIRKYENQVPTNIRESIANLELLIYKKYIKALNHKL